MIRTSYYRNVSPSDDNLVSISRSEPPGFQDIESYPALAPSKFLLNDYKAGRITDAQYTVLYEGDVLAMLPVDKVAKDLEGKTLLCWEARGFCHRHLVAKWLVHAGYECEELPKRDGKNRKLF